MTTDLETASAIAKKVSKKMKQWDIPTEVQYSFVLMVAQVVKELRRDERRRRKEKATESTEK